MNWNEATEFCKKLTEREQKAGKLPEEWEYRLPTEAEWQYACRAGTITVYSFGDDESQLGEYAWYAPNTRNYAQEVGLKKPNAWGLHDMHGNAWEWSSDWKSEELVDGRDPEAPQEGPHRVRLGGGALNSDGGCRSAARGGVIPSHRGNALGIRVVLSPSSTEKPAAAIATFGEAVANSNYALEFTRGEDFVTIDGLQTEKDAYTIEGWFLANTNNFSRMFSLKGDQSRPWVQKPRTNLNSRISGQSRRENLNVEHCDCRFLAVNRTGTIFPGREFPQRRPRSRLTTNFSALKKTSSRPFPAVLQQPSKSS